MVMKSPWGSEIVESKQKTSPFGRPLPAEPAAKPNLKDFKELGLDETDARAALDGLAEGRYLSFEDAALSRSIFGREKPVRINESLMREKAREFAGPALSESDNT